MSGRQSVLKLPSTATKSLLLLLLLADTPVPKYGRSRSLPR